MYQPKAGDYILDNGAIFMFCAGDSRILRQEGFSSYRHIKLTKKAISEIDLKSLDRKEYKELGDMPLIKYYYR